MRFWCNADLNSSSIRTRVFQVCAHLGTAILLYLLSFSDAEETFLRFWTAVDAQLFPGKVQEVPHSHGSQEGGTRARRPQEQSLQNAFIGFRAALLVLHFIKQKQNNLTK